MMQDKRMIRVKHTYIILKLAILMLLVFVARRVKNNRVYEEWRIRGVNPANHCIIDYSHQLLNSAHNTLLQFSFLKVSLQLLSSFMIDTTFVYGSILWYFLSHQGFSNPQTADFSTRFPCSTV